MYHWRGHWTTSSTPQGRKLQRNKIRPPGGGLCKNSDVWSDDDGQISGVWTDLQQHGPGASNMLFLALTESRGQFVEDHPTRRVCPTRTNGHTASFFHQRTQGMWSALLEWRCADIWQMTATPTRGRKGHSWRRLTHLTNVFSSHHVPDFKFVRSCCGKPSKLVMMAVQAVCSAATLLQLVHNQAVPRHV